MGYHQQFRVIVTDICVCVCVCATPARGSNKVIKINNETEIKKGRINYIYVVNTPGPKERTRAPARGEGPRGKKKG